MSMATLLRPYGGGLACDDAAKNVFDIHGGGIDLVFPHHENEIAQSCCAFGAPRMANVWMHNGFLQVEGEKMSKSLGNFFTIHELLRTDAFGGRAWPGEVLRFAMLRTHYRQPLGWTLRSVEESEKALRRFAQVAASARAPAAEPSPELAAALSDDLNTPAAIAHLHGLEKSARDGSSSEAGEAAAQLARDAEFLGVDLAAAAKGSTPDLSEAARARIEALVAERQAKRRAKDWAASDRLREELASLGVTVEDTKDGAKWEVRR